LVAEASQVLETVIDNLDAIRDLSDEGVRTLAEALRWGGAAYHNAGWNPRHIEGSEHFFFYTLEYLTGRPFVHGQAVGLGIYTVAALQENRADEMLATLRRLEVDIRPQAMGITWEEAAEAMRRMGRYAEREGLPYTVINERPVTDAFVRNVRQRVESTFG
jgi:glycerol dehydrogenase-like iron-containing ADH family enzyme